MMETLTSTGELLPNQLASFMASRKCTTGHPTNSQPATVNTIRFEKDPGLVTRLLGKLNAFGGENNSGVPQNQLDSHFHELEVELEHLRKRCFLVDD